MKTRLLSCLAVAALGLTACQKDGSGSGGNQKITVREAREFFEGQMATVKSSDWLDPHEGHAHPFSPGDFTPLWDRAAYVEAAGTASIEVLLDARNSYFAVYGGEKDAVIQKLLVSKPQGGALQAAIATVLPMHDYYIDHPDFAKKLSVAGGKGEFRGVIVFQTLEGDVLHVDQYQDGKMTESVSVEGGYVTDLAFLNAMLGGNVILAYIPVQTRMYCIMHEGDTYQANCTMCRSMATGRVVCATCSHYIDTEGRCGCEHQNKCSSCQMYYVSGTAHTCSPTGGGTGGSDPKDPPPANAIPIQMAYSGCPGSVQSNISALQNRFSQMASTSGLASFLQTIRSSSYNYWQAFESDWGWGMLTTSFPNSGGLMGERLAIMHSNSYATAEAFCHMLYNIGALTSELSDLYIVVPAPYGELKVYILHVESYSKIRDFFYGNTGGPSYFIKSSGYDFKEDVAIGQTFYTAYGRFNYHTAYQETDKKSYALAYALDQFDPGIRLFEGRINGTTLSNVVQLGMDGVVNSGTTILRRCTY